MNDLINLLIALALGLLIGMERGWVQRTEKEGRRLAGVRTFGLIGLLGALWAMLSQQLGELLLGLAFIAFTGLLIFGYIKHLQLEHDYGITTLVAALITFALGALTMLGQQLIAASTAVLTAILLSLKPLLHEWLRRIEQKEIYATLKLLLISVVLLPVLPDRGYGPWAALNPYELWWLVVLIAGISFFGYVAMRVLGAGRGILLTGLFGGLASSTASTLHFARLGKTRSELIPLVAAGILVASATMFPRMLLEIAVLNPALVAPMLAPMLGMLIMSLAGAFWFWRHRSRDTSPDAPLSNPFQLQPALKFGALLAVVILFTHALHAWLGQRGLYIAAGVSGLADVDAITLSVTRMTRDTLSLEVARNALTLVAAVNTLVKGVLALIVGGRRLAVCVLPVLALTAATGPAIVFLV